MRSFIVLASLIVLAVLANGCSDAEAFIPPATATVTCFSGQNAGAPVVTTGYPITGTITLKNGHLQVETDATTHNVVIADGWCIAS